MAVGKLMFCLEHRLGWDSLDNARDLETALESYICLVYNTPGILLIPRAQATIPLTLLTILFPRNAYHHNGHEFRSHPTKYPGVLIIP
jgi:hypothetical protein